MYASDDTQEHVDRDQRNDPRSRPAAEELVVERTPVVADRSDTTDSNTMFAGGDRRRGDRRRIERMSTDI